MKLKYETSEDVTRKHTQNMKFNGGKKISTRCKSRMLLFITLALSHKMCAPFFLAVILKFAPELRRCNSSSIALYLRAAISSSMSLLLFIALKCCPRCARSCLPDAAPFNRASVQFLFGLYFHCTLWRYEWYLIGLSTNLILKELRDFCHVFLSVCLPDCRFGALCMDQQHQLQ